MLKIFVIIIIFGIVFTLYVISGIRYMERMNQAREEKKNKL